ncbi:hypothetical protein G9A89_006829 [Geosiphon pyriformis]|nr:hypothetical protein G9A89_006829 [Geosiphon pyriformis]
MRLILQILLSSTFTALGTTLYLFYYTIFCQWKWPDSDARILLLADPQIEGDAKIFRQGIRGEIDLFGNDLYFRHIYTSFVSRYSFFKPSPTHVILLGDLFSSQLVTDQEFEKRVNRFKWIFGDPNSEYAHKLVNITGNHDIGYNFDMTRHRVDRWQRVFGPTNFVEWILDQDYIHLSEDNITHEEERGHQLVIINAQNIDGPAMDEDLRAETWDFLDWIADERKEDYLSPFILVSHIPIYKPEGLCVDGPMTIYNQSYIEEQNHLSLNASEFILTRLRPRFIFAGHDHEGCDVTHVVRVINEETGKVEQEFVVREVTVRSMMGAYGGNAGLFEIRKGDQKSEKDYEYHYSSCPFVISHIPWVVAVVDLLVLLSWVIWWTFLGISILITKIDRRRRKLDLSTKLVNGKKTF